jgi:ElaB/YqjD/DUF883 family membrane-anchored ribosome-binding protein
MHLDRSPYQAVPYSDRKERAMAIEDANRVKGVDRIADRAHEAIDAAREQASGMVGGLKGLVHEAGERLKETASTAGKRLEGAGHSVRDQAPAEGVMGAAAGSVADVLERTGDYLEKQELRDIGRDLRSLLRRRPIQTVLVSVGAGYLLGRIMRR